MVEKCEEFSCILNDYLDNNLNKSQIESLELHLANCNNCKNELKELKDTIEAIGKLNDMNIPRAKESFASDIINQLKKETKPNGVYYFKYIAASVIAISIVSFAVINFSQPPKATVAVNNTTTITEEEYNEYFSSFNEEEDASLIAKAGFPTDEYGLLDLNGTITDE